MSKEKRLVEFLKRHGPVAVAFSGGVDSTLVAAAAHRADKNSLAVTVADASVPRKELEGAKKTARVIGIRHVVVRNSALGKEYLKNDENRCYYCKRKTFQMVSELARKHGIKTIVDGTNADDLGDFRPGIRAGTEAAVLSPLAGLGFTKAEVRTLARRWKLPNFAKPASPCLSSRIARGTQITVERLKRVERAEEIVKELTGCRIVRVRDRQEGAVVEVGVEERKKLLNLKIWEKLDKKLRQLGFKRVLVNLGGYMMGGT